MITLSMSKFRASIFTALLAFAPLLPAAHAQYAGAFARVNVPFAFEIGSGHYPAGVYTIGMDSPSVLMIRGASASGLAIMAPMDDNGQRAKSGSPQDGRPYRADQRRDRVAFAHRLRGANHSAGRPAERLSR